MRDRIEIWKGDITKLAVDAIVNAANESLMGGGGVDGAIHLAAGDELLAECETLGGCQRGQAKITKGYRLPAKHVIHAVGPVWHGGKHGEDDLLADCYRNSLALAEQNGLTSIAFSAISTGVYGFPMDRAVSIALREIIAFLPTSKCLKKVILVSYGSEAYQVHRSAYDEMVKYGNSVGQVA